jgi:hypothetical protein
MSDLNAEPAAPQKPDLYAPVPPAIASPPTDLAPRADNALGQEGQDPSHAPDPEASSEAADPSGASQFGSNPASQSTPASEFDPNQYVELGAHAHVDEFEQVTNDAIIRSLSRARSVVPPPTIRDFSTLNDAATWPTQGEFAFTVNRLRCCAAITAVCEAAGLGKAARAVDNSDVRICLSQFEIKLRKYTAPITFETAVSAERLVSGVADEEKVAFSLDLRQLRKLSRLPADPDETLTGVFDASRSRLIIRSELTSLYKAKLKLTTWRDENFGGVYAEQLNSITHVRPFDPVVLRQALQFQELFAKKDDLLRFFSQVEVRDGLVLAGSHTALGVVESEKLKGLNFNIRYDLLSTITALLAQFDGSFTNLFDAKNHHIIYDGRSFLAFEKHPYRFPDTPPPLLQKRRARVCLPRTTLIERLRELALVSPRNRDDDFLVHIRVTGYGRTMLSLGSCDPSRWSTGVAAIDCLRTPEDQPGSQLPPFTCSVNLQRLLAVVSFFRTANIEFEELPNRTASLRLRLGDGEYCAIALLGAVRHGFRKTRSTSVSRFGRA